MSLFGIVVATVLAYRMVLFNFFCGDDFVHLEWLNRAISHTELIWRNFYSNWLDVPTCQFYRPMISIFMVGDYLLWRTNGLGFHLTNLITHLVSTLMLYLVLTELALRVERSANELNWKPWPICSAALFALYPLHPEAVSWITGRVDTIVTMFCLASFWCYLKAKRTGNTAVLVASLLLFFLALMSKEMAIIEPAIIFTLEFLLPGKRQTMGKRLISTWPFWVSLGAYFLLRRFALGTFIGGYDDSLQIGTIVGRLSAWARALKTMLWPFNAELSTAFDSLRILWTVSCLSAIAFFFRNFIDRALRPLASFLIAWTVLSLVPVFKLLDISPDLQGSRLVYLATAPLCALLCFGLVGPQKRFASGYSHVLAKVIVFAMLSLSYLTLARNNEPWHEAGVQSQAILTQLDGLYRNSAANPPTYCLGLADTVHGAFLIRNALDGMTKKPQISRDAKDCFVLDNFDPIYPFGFEKRIIEDKSSSARVLLWNPEAKCFRRVGSLGGADYFSRKWSGIELQKFAASPSGDNRRMVFCLQNVPCWRSEFVVFRLSGLTSVDEVPGLSLAYTNDLYPNFDMRHRVPGIICMVDGAPEAVFRLRGEIDWLFGSSGHQFTIVSSKPINFSVDQMRIEGPDQFVPELSIQETANQNRGGYMQLTPQYRSGAFSYDVSKMPGAVSAQLEVTKPSTFFAVHNSPHVGTEIGLTRSLAGDEGKLTLNKDEFPKYGIYQVRIRAVDRSGNPIGFASDHLLVSVSN